MDRLSGRIIAESVFLEPLKPGSPIAPGFGGRVYFSTGKGFIVLRVMPKSSSPESKQQEVYVSKIRKGANH